MSDDSPESLLTMTIDDILKPAGKREWSALDILHNPKVSDRDKIELVLRPQLIREPLLYEASCRFAEYAFESARYIGFKVDDRSMAAVEARRKWLRGEIDDEQLELAADDALAATGEAFAAAGAVVDMVRVSRLSTMWSALTAALNTAWSVCVMDPDKAAVSSVFAARNAAYAVGHNSGCAAQRQVQILIELLSEE